MTCQNEGMTPWTRIGNELHAKKMTWTQLGVALSCSKQTVSNWKNKGVPSKFYTAIDRFFGKQNGWTEGIEEVAHQSGHTFSPLALALAALFDTIPESEVKTRSRIFVEAAGLINALDEQQTPTAAGAVDSKKQPA